MIGYRRLGPAPTRVGPNHVGPNMIDYRELGPNLVVFFWSQKTLTHNTDGNGNTGNAKTPNPFWQNVGEATGEI